MDYNKKYLKYKNKYLNLNKQVGGSALIQTIYLNQINRVRDLLDKGSDVNEIDQFYCYSALEIALTNGHNTIFKLLLERGANFNYINSSGDSCLRLAYLYSQKRELEYDYEIIHSLFHRGVIIDDKARKTIHDSRDINNFKFNILSCLEKIDQATNGNIEYFKKIPLIQLLYNIKIWINYLPEAAYRELLLWAKPKLPEQISTLYGKTADESKPTDYAENRESVGIPGLPASQIIDYIISPKYLEIKKKFYDELVKSRL